ncbi:MAG: hypothetical protein ACT4OJ_03995 [Bacteroidota bacterium]
MKKVLICAAALTAMMALHAQNKKGNWLVGAGIGSTGISFGESESGTVGGASVNKSKSNSFSIGVYPTLGYYVSDDIVVGSYVTLGYSTSNSDNSNTSSSATSESKSHYAYFGLSPFARFYFGGNNSKGMPFAQLNAGITFYPGYKGEYKPSTGTGYTYEYKKYHPLNFGAQFGYEHFINSVIGLQYYIGYSYSKSKYDTFYDYPSSPDFTYFYEGSNHNINFGAGLQIHLACDKKKKK